MSLKKKLLKNGIATGFQKLVKVLEQLLLVPFFISAWGAAYYGEWLTLTIIPSVLAFADLGFGSAAANGFVIRYVSGDKQNAADYRRTGLTVITLMVSAGMLISVITMFVLDKTGVFHKSLIKSDQAIISVSAMILSRLLSFYNQLSESYYRAERRASLSINLLTLNSLLLLAGGGLVLFLGGGVVIFSICQFFISLIFVIFYSKRGSSLLRFEASLSGRFNKVFLKEIMGKGVGYLMSPVWQAIFFQGTTLAVRVTLGPQAVAIFNTARTLSRSINQVFTMVNNSVFPELQYEINNGNKLVARRLFLMSVFGVLIISVVGSLLLWFIGPWFYQIWTSNQLKVPSNVWLFFVIGILFNAVWFTAGMVFRVFNNPYPLAVGGVFASLISVGISYFLSKKIGLEGAALGGLMMDIIMAVYILPKSFKIMKITNTDIIDMYSYVKLLRTKN